MNTKVIFPANGRFPLDKAHTRGVALIATLIVLFFVTLLAASLIGYVYSRLSDITLEVDSYKAMCLAEAGMSLALNEMSTGIDEDGNGIGNINATSLGEGVYRVYNNVPGQSLTSIGIVHGMRKVVFIKYG